MSGQSAPETEEEKKARTNALISRIIEAFGDEMNNGVVLSALVHVVSLVLCGLPLDLRPRAIAFVEVMLHEARHTPAAEEQPDDEV